MMWWFRRVKLVVYCLMLVVIFALQIFFVLLVGVGQYAAQLYQDGFGSAFFIMMLGGFVLWVLPAVLDPGNEDFELLFKFICIAAGGAFVLIVMPMIAAAIMSMEVFTMLRSAQSLVATEGKHWLAVAQKILFLIYVVSFVVDLVFERVVNEQDTAGALMNMAKKYWKELVDLFEFFWDIVASRRAGHN